MARIKGLAVSLTVVSLVAFSRLIALAERMQSGAARRASAPPGT